MNYKFRFFVILNIIFLTTAVLFAQESGNFVENLQKTQKELTVVAVEEGYIKTDAPVLDFSWNSDDRYFSYTQQSSIYIADSVTVKPLCQLPMQESQSSVFWDAGKNSYYMAVDKTGFFKVWVRAFYGEHKETDEDLSYQLVTQSDFVASACSRDGMNIAVADANGNLRIYFYLRYTSHILPNKIVSDVDSPVSYITFSPDNELVAFLHTDGTLDLYDTHSLKLKNRFKSFPGGKVKPSFSGDSKNFAWQKSVSSVQIVRLETEEETIITVPGEVKAISLIADTDFVAVQQNNDELQIYSVEDEKFLGTVGSFADSPMTSFAFSSDGLHILEGFEDGSIFMARMYVDTEENLAAKGIKATAFEKKRPEGVDPAGRIEVIVEDPKTPDQPVPDIIIPEKNKNVFVKEDGIFPYFGASILNGSYAAGVKTGAEYMITSLVIPMIFGAGFDVQVGFPGSNYPNTYVNMDGNRVPQPMVYSMTLKIPVGVYYYNALTKMFVAATVSGGVKGFNLMLISPGMTGTSKFHFAPVVAGEVWFFVNNIGGCVGISWDPTFSFVPYMNVGYRFSLKTNWRKNAKKN
ncbi:MAG: WD40 repeat domain-containing protein [Treponema sp.]|nr:WD40 repeat domain-containing protein [Treponema sp.]